MSKVRIASCSPRVTVACPDRNADNIIAAAKEAAAAGADLIVFPELAVSGCSCGDLFLQDSLIRECGKALDRIAAATADYDGYIVVGCPARCDEALFDCAYVIHTGQIRDCFCKTEGAENPGCLDYRYFSSEGGEGRRENDSILMKFGSDYMECGIVFGALPAYGSFYGDLLINISEGIEFIGRNADRIEQVRAYSRNYACVLASSGPGESSGDYVYTGLKIIAGGGRIIDSACEDRDIIYGDIDTDGFTEAYAHEYGRAAGAPSPGFTPYLPGTDPATIGRAFELQVLGLAGRMQAINCHKAVIGISGGLDSTLALLVAVRAFDRLGYDRKDILAVTMPCYGTSETTHNFALGLMQELGVSYREINIREAVSLHLRDIGHDPDNHNVAFENAQARERTQILMDLANDLEAIVIGTGDMSEAALGWCTYNGDHMSMYDVNAGVPKTLVRLIVKNIADISGSCTLSSLLNSIIELPVSPELIPGKDGEIAQRTEDIIGPYILHDFIMYHMVYGHRSPGDIYELIKETFAGTYGDDTVRKTLRTFYDRFFKSQFKRSCSVDGPMILCFSLSPRGGLMIPSDACGRLWLDEIDKL